MKKFNGTCYQESFMEGLSENKEGPIIINRTEVKQKYIKFLH